MTQEEIEAEDREILSAYREMLPKIDTILDDIPDVECPHCGTELYSYHGDDPLKKHMEFCEPQR